MAQDTIAALSSLTSIPLWLLVIVIIWSLIWKGLALWKAARKNHLLWFVAILIINTVGILEILYIYVFSEIFEQPRSRKNKKKQTTENIKTKTTKAKKSSKKIKKFPTLD